MTRGEERKESKQIGMDGMNEMVEGMRQITDEGNEDGIKMRMSKEEVGNKEVKKKRNKQRRRWK